MYQFKICIAGRIIEVETVHVLPKALSRIFFAEGIPDFRVKITQEDINSEKTRYEKNNGYTCSWDGNIEMTILLRKIAERLPDYGAFMMHGAAISVNNKAFVFSGESGVGKTTHIKKWLKTIPDSFVINGDKPCILTNPYPIVCGSPWAGKENMKTNTMIPMKAVIFLERAAENSIRRVSISDAFPYLLQQTFHSADEKLMRKTLLLLKGLNSYVSFYQFRMNNFRDDCFDVVYNTLVGLDT